MQAALVMIGRRRRRAAERRDHHFRLQSAKLRRQAIAVLRAVHEHPVGQAEVDPHRHAEDLPRRFGLDFAGLVAAARRRLAAGQVDHADAIALLDELGERPAADDFKIVRVRSDGDHVERLFVHGGTSGYERCLQIPPQAATLKRGTQRAGSDYCESLAMPLYTWAIPPSTKSSIPVTKLLSSDARNSATVAISSDAPMRPSGT